MKIAYFKILDHLHFMETFNKAIIIIKTNKIKIANHHIQVAIPWPSNKVISHQEI